MKSKQDHSNVCRVLGVHSNKRISYSRLYCCPYISFSRPLRNRDGALDLSAHPGQHVGEPSHRGSVELPTPELFFQLRLTSLGSPLSCCTGAKPFAFLGGMQCRGPTGHLANTLSLRGGWYYNSGVILSKFLYVRRPRPRGGTAPPTGNSSLAVD